MSAAAGFEIRELRLEDLEDVLELVRTALGPGSTPRTEEFWRWKHELGPFGSSPGWVAIADQRVVGLRVFLRWRFRLGARCLEAARAVDTATHPDWLRRGIFSGLTRQALDLLPQQGCSLVFNTPNRQSGAGYFKLGWRNAPKPAIQLLPIRPLSLARATIGGRTEPVATDLSGFPSVGETLDSAQLEPLLDGYAAACDDRLHTDRSFDFLRWRYSAIPGIDYRALALSDGDSQALTVFRTRLRHSLREIVVSEFLTVGARGAELAKGLLEQLRSADADYLVAAAPQGSGAQALLRRLGFRRLPWGPTLVVRALGQEPTSDFLAGDSWHLSAGDLEIF